MSAIRATLKEEAKNLAVYVVILIVFLMLLDNKTGGLKNEINTTVRVECLNGQTNMILGKYDDLVNGLVSQQLTAERLNAAKRDTTKAAADAAFASRFKGDLIAITKPNCSKPLLP